MIKTIHSFFSLGERRRKASPEPVLTERNIFQALCTHCKNRNPNNANCLSVCLGM